MKKMTMMCMAALLLMAVSCKKEKANEEYTGEGFRATTESHTGEGDSKTQLNSDLSVTWCDGDEIKVFNSDQNGKKFSAASAGTEADFNPKEDVTDAFFTPPYTAFYPESAVRGTNQIHLDGTQHYTTFDDGNGNNVLTFASGENPMAAQSTSKVLSFKNLCGILKFQLYSENPCTVKTLCVTSLKTGEQLWGTGTVSFNGADATLDALTGGTGSITLDCSNKDVELGTVDAPTEFMFVIPDGALSEGFMVTVTDADNKVWSKTTTASNTITKSKIKAMPKQAVETKPGIPEGALPGLFSVSDTKQVYFSQGNLQYTTTGSHSVAGGGTATGTWRFAEHQFDFIGADNANAAQTYTGWIDLFGWGTSNWNNGNYFYQPYNTDATTYAATEGFGYGPTNHISYEFSLTGDYANADWGVNCAISNGGNQAGKWRTLTEEERYYLLFTRRDVNNKVLYGEGKVDSTTGLIILPDDWSWTGDVAGFGESWTPGGSIWLNVYSYSEWAKMEAAGAVFLPTAGRRYETTVYNVGSSGYYWTSSCYGTSAHDLYIGAGGIGSLSYSTRCFGFAVRLVSTTPPVGK